MKYLYQNFSKYISKNIHYVFIVTLILVIIDRFNCFLQFSKIYTDSDQTILWLVSKDILNLEFYQPCFYGQNYNPIVESILAIPLLKLGVSYEIALPFITTFLSVTPIILVAFFLYKKVNKHLGVIPLIISLSMSVEYLMLTSITRGFVTGIFFWIIGFLFLYFYNSNFSKLLGGFLIGIGIYMNMNCLILMPILMTLWPKIKSNLNAWKLIIIGLFIGLSSIVINKIFYLNNQNLIIHDSPSLKFSIDSFYTVIKSLDNYFDFVSPFIWKAGWLSFFLFIFICIKLWIEGKKELFFIVLSIFLTIISTFFIEKVSDATNSVFFSGARMYLAYPYIIIFVLIISSRINFKIDKKYLFSGILMISILLFLLKLFAFNFFLNNALRGSANSIVKITKIDQLKMSCQSILEFSDKKIDLILSNTGSTSDQPITYGCQCLIDSFPKTYKPIYERRTWLNKNYLNSTFNRILITETDTNSLNLLKNNKIKIIRTKGNWILIETNLKVQEILTLLKINSN